MLNRISHFMLDGAFGVNIKAFGPSGMVGNGDPVYDGPAFTKALSYLQTESDYRGGTLILPRGIYRPSATVNMTQFAAGLIHGTYLKGEGVLNTSIMGEAMPADSDIVTFGQGTHFGIEGLMLSAGKRFGLRLQGGNLGSSGFLAQGYAKDLRIQQCANDGLRSENSFMLTLDNIWASGNGQCGFNFRGFHTTIKMGKLWALGHHNAPGYQINSMVYSSMESCGSDDNKWGYAFSNVAGFTMNGCGAEASLNESILMQANDASAVGANTESQNISAFVINGGFWLKGNLAGAAGARSNFIGAVADNNRSIDVVLNGNRSIAQHTGVPFDPAIAGTAVTAGSRVRFRGTGNAFDTANQFSGAGTAEFIGT